MRKAYFIVVFFSILCVVLVEKQTARTRRFSLPLPGSIDDPEALDLLVNPSTLVENETDSLLVRCRVKVPVESIEQLGLYICNSNFHDDRGVLQVWSSTQEMVVSDRYTQEFGTVAWGLSGTDNYVHLRQSVRPSCQCSCWGCFATMKKQGEATKLSYKVEFFLRVQLKEREPPENPVTVTPAPLRVERTDPSRLPTVLTVIMSVLAGVLFFLGTGFLAMRRRKLLRSVTSIAIAETGGDDPEPPKDKRSFFGSFRGKGDHSLGPPKGSLGCVQEGEDNLRRDSIEECKRNRYLVDSVPEHREEDATHSERASLSPREEEAWRSLPPSDKTGPGRSQEGSDSSDPLWPSWPGGHVTQASSEGEWRRSRLRERLSRDSTSGLAEDARSLQETGTGMNPQARRPFRSGSSPPTKYDLPPVKHIEKVEQSTSESEHQKMERRHRSADSFPPQ